jgi:uncharacterized protein
MLPKMGTTMEGMMSKRQRETERRFVGAQVAPVELRAGKGQPAELHGYASVFNQEATIQDLWGDAWIESVAPGAFARTIGQADIRALFNHDPNIILGRNRAGTLDLVEDGTGLRSIIQPPDSSWGASVLESVKRGDVSGMSIAFQVVQEKWKRGENKGDLSHRTITEAALLDVSVVTYPAFEQTSVQARGMGFEGGALDVVAQAFRLTRLAKHGFPLEAEDRAVIKTAMAVLLDASVDPTGNGHSTEQPGNDSGTVGVRYSLAERERRLKVLRMSMEMER